MKQKERYRHKRKGSGLIPAWPDSLPTPDTVARTAVYVGSAEHKHRPVDPSYQVDPALRSDASRCDPSIVRARAEEALREGIRRLCVSQDFEGAFPRYVWARLDGVPYIARVINVGLGQYKGWPIEELELPLDREGRLARDKW